jgi:MtaA/CmuA family methyltransferase
MAAVESLAQCIALETPDQLPVFCHSERFDAAYCNLYYRTYCSDAQVLVDCQAHANERFGWDWVWVHLDDVLELEPYGIVTSEEEDDPRRVLRPVALTPAVLRGLRPDTVLQAERLEVLLRGLTGLRATFGDTRVVCGRLSGPLTLVNLLFGPEATQAAVADNAPVLRDALDLAVEINIELAEAQAAAGCHALWVDDRLACSDLVPASVYESLLLAPTARLLAAIRSLDVWSMLHTAENNLAALKVHAQTGPDVLSVGSLLPMGQAHSALGKQVALMGNLDPIVLLTKAWPSQLAAYVDNLVRVMKQGGMALATAGPVPREARGPNLHTMVDTARKIWEIVAGR